MNTKTDMKSLIGSNPEVIATFLIPFFKALEDEGVVWAVAHGWEGLPTYARHDVDIALRRKDLKLTVSILKDIASKTGWINYCHFKSSNLHSYWILLPGEEISYFQVDIFLEASLRGIPFFSSDKWLMNRWKNENGIWCMPYSYSGASVLLKELIANSKLEREARHSQVFDGIVKDRDNFIALLNEAFKGDIELVSRVVKVVERKEWELLPELAPEIRRKVMRPRVGNIFGILVYIFDHIRLRLFPFLRPFIALVGPDGCGKTTIADAIVNHFDHRPLCGLMRIHSDFPNAIRLRDIYKKIMSVFGKKVEFKPDPKPGTRGMGMKPPLGMFRSMFYIMYYGMTLALGRIALFRWRTFSGLLLADRYYYDYYYMRGHMKCPKWWKDFVGLIVPKPDIVFVLERPAEEIYRQKPELEVEEIKRQQIAIRRCFDKNRRVRFIDASKGIETTIKQVNCEIEKWIMSYGG
jgi:thymidylate kinase